MKDLSDPIQWLIEEGSHCRNSAVLIDKLAGLFIAFGLEPMRINIVQGALHPEVMVKLFVWRPESGFVETSKTAQIFASNEQTFTHGVVKDISLGNSTFRNPPFLISPLFQVMKKQAALIHEPMPPGCTEYRFPILQEYHEQGGTDYLALPIIFTNGKRGCLSCVTRKDGGFTEQDIDNIQTVMPPLNFILEIHAYHWLTSTLLQTYLGSEPGQRVLSGDIKRGDVNTLNAAIWFSDLRGFTKMSGRLNANDLISLLNEYFELIGLAVKEHQGEVLKFIGDAVLAIFPVQQDTSSNQACINAFEAAKSASEMLEKQQEALTEKYGVPVKHGIALNFGEVKYGNIGSLERLDFTVIGQAVNLASRIEGLCSELNSELLLSSEFLQQTPTDRVLRDTEIFQSCGYFSLKGMDKPEEVFRVGGKSI